MSCTTDNPDIFVFSPPEGSLQPKISGRYKYLSKTVLKKDCFYCAHNGYYIYPLDHTSYGIGRRLGGNSVVVKIMSEDIMVGDCLVWSKQDQDYIKYDDIDIWIDGDESHDPGEVDYAPQALYVNSKYNNVHGGYVIIAKTCCERPVYYSEEKSMYIIYTGENWIVGPQDNVSAGFTYVAESQKSTATFPTDCVWTEGMVVQEVVDDGVEMPDYEIQYQSGHIDKEFPPVKESIGDEADVPANIRWWRALHLLSGTGPQLLYESVVPHDLLHGATGDCWLLAAIATIAEFPGYIENNLIKEKGVNAEGKYTIQLYDLAKQGWIDIEIDDFVPCKERQWYESRPRPLISQPNGNEMYVLLLEKAFAKYVGTYSKLSGSIPPYAWTHMTGCETQFVWDLFPDESRAKKSIISVDFRRSNPRNFQDIFTEEDPEGSCSYEDFFSYLRDCDQSNYVVACSIAPKPGQKIKDKKRADGLVEGHAYSLLEVRIIPGNDGNRYRLLKMRNCWGDCQQWNGKWSEGSPAWSAIDQAHLYAKNEADGIFWMQYSDFLACFTTVMVCPLNMKSQRGRHKLRENSICSDQFDLIIQNVRSSSP